MTTVSGARTVHAVTGDAQEVLNAIPDILGASSGIVVAVVGIARGVADGVVGGGVRACIAIGRIEVRDSWEGIVAVGGVEVVPGMRC